jgi:predicted deacylase
MQTQTLPLVPGSPGQSHHLQVLRYGAAGRGPKAMIQAALHADEVPALLVAHHLRSSLQALDAQGLVAGEVVLVPFANPLGLAQQVWGQHQGRFDLRDGVNFNRGIPELAQAAGDAVQGRLGAHAQANQALVRQALRDAAAALSAVHPVQDLKNRLLQLAIDSDIVLDLHCDAESVLHLYALTPQADIAGQLGCLMGARAILLATESGDSPFDEACSAPWHVLQQRYPAHPLPLGCFAATVELRGQADTSHVLARQDADAILDFLRLRGVLSGPVPVLPAPLCSPTPLAASEPVTAPCAGVVVFHAETGQVVEAGDLVAELVDPALGGSTPLHARSAGVLYARAATRWATPGARLAKIAGSTLQRTGKLLSA